MLLNLYYNLFFVLLGMGQKLCCELDPEEIDHLKYRLDHHQPYYHPTAIGQRQERKYTKLPHQNQQKVISRLNPFVKQKINSLKAYPIKFRQSSECGELKNGYYRINETGTLYKGQWKNGEPHGVGQLFFQNGSYFYGTFSTGFVHGQGRFIHYSGSYYQGQIRLNVAQGRGTFINENQQYQYYGDWTQDLPNGKGEEHWKDGTLYKGQFSNGSKHGKGFYKFSNGSTYQGYFKHDKFHGQGKLNIPEGQYEGFFNKGQMEGYGTFKWKDGSFYQGNYIRNKKHGIGKYISKQGKIYEGMWQNGYRHGEGKVYNQIGASMTGLWQFNQYQA